MLCLITNIFNVTKHKLLTCFGVLVGNKKVVNSVTPISDFPSFAPFLTGCRELREGKYCVCSDMYVTAVSF